MVRRKLSRTALAAAAGLILTTQSVGQIVENTGTIPVEILESSGVAVSRSYPGILWTHNDSGEEAIIWALRLNGDPVVSLQVAGARIRDWEDASIAPCLIPLRRSGDCIYIADTGDNLERRRSATIYVLPEPNPFERRSRTERATRIDFTYEGGAVDVESLAVDSGGTAWLVTKGRTWPVRLFALDLSAALTSGRRQVVATVVDTLSLPRTPLVGWVTGAALSPSGQRLLVRTYVDIYSYLRNETGHWILTPPACHLGAIEPQGEALDFLDEETLVLTSEALPGRPGPIHTVRCP